MTIRKGVQVALRISNQALRPSSRNNSFEFHLRFGGSVELAQRLRQVVTREWIILSGKRLAQQFESLGGLSFGDQDPP